jgi:hypothetical protein
MSRAGRTRWLRCIAFLKPGGRFYAEEVLDRFVLHRAVRRLLTHPLENRFDASTFAGALAHLGFTIDGTRKLAGLFAWVVATKSGSVEVSEHTGLGADAAARPSPG